MAENINIQYTDISKIGFTTCNVPHDVMDAIRSEIQEMFDTNFKDAFQWNKRLVGAIEQEYGLYKCVDKVEKFVCSVAPHFVNLNKSGIHREGPLSGENVQWKLGDSFGRPTPGEINRSHLWVNIQKKYEYNPLHDHSGTLSFVIWVNIPYDMEEEAKVPHNRRGGLVNLPRFSFFIPNSIPSTPKNYFEWSLHVDKTFEGRMAMFPSWLGHHVTPFFTSDGYRISVSGNLVPVKNV